MKLSPNVYERARWSNCMQSANLNGGKASNIQVKLTAQGLLDP